VDNNVYKNKFKYANDLINDLQVVKGFIKYWDELDVNERRLFLDRIKAILYDSDWLIQMFEKQRKLDQVIIDKKASFIPETKDILTEAVDEIFEARRHVPHKWWKKQEKHEPELFCEEMVDHWHFSISAFIKEGFSAAHLYSGYIDKSKINHQRAESDY